MKREFGYSFCEHLQPRTVSIVFFFCMAPNADDTGKKREKKHLVGSGMCGGEGGGLKKA